MAEEYRATLRLGRVDTDMIYLDPTQPIPPLADLVSEPNAEDRADGQVALSEPIVRIFLLAALGALLAFLWFAARGQFVRLAAEPSVQPGRTGRGDTHTLPEAAPPPSLEQIRSSADYRAGAIALLHLTLPRALESNGLHLHPSWTARDVLARVPDAWPLRGDLTTLVRAAEEAHFGNYPVTETSFATYLAAAERILAPGQPS